MKRRMREALSGRAVYVGCRRCGETDKQLRRAADGGLYCPACYAAVNVPESGTKENARAAEGVGPYEEDEI